jgi:hypothetical protein
VKKASREAEQRKKPPTDGGRGRRCGWTGGGPIEGANWRSGGRRPWSSRNPESAAWKEQRRLDGGSALPDSRCCHCPLLFPYLISFPPTLDLCAAGMGRAREGGIRARFPARAAAFPPVRRLPQPIGRQVDALAREATP